MFGLLGVRQSPAPRWTPPVQGKHHWPWSLVAAASFFYYRLFGGNSRRELETVLQDQSRLLQITSALDAVVWLREAPTGRLLYVNPAYERVWGRSRESLYQDPDSFLDAIHPDDHEQARQGQERRREGIFSDEEYRVVGPDGSIRWISSRTTPIRDGDGLDYRWLSVLQDVTRFKRAEEQLAHDALHDGLTGLPNRTALMDRIEQAIKRSRRNPGSAFAILFLDLDRFKLVNDSLGHAAGDRLLKEIAPRLGTCIRSVDTLARLGGDEFVILLEDADSVIAVKEVAERILAQFAEPFHLDRQPVFTTPSIGIVVDGEHYERADEMLRDADIAMYRAKNLGKARYAIFDRSMHEDVMERLELEADLRRAVEGGELEVYYQPIVSLRTGEITALEALVRWVHPRRGLLGPAQFLSVAEESGLVVPLDQWVLKTACTQMREWQDRFPAHPPVGLHVNLSGRHLTRSNLVESIAGVIRTTGLEPSLLRLEFPESAITENREPAEDMLNRLYVAGVQVQIDNFGRGMSSLGMLVELPVHTIKIDRSLGRTMGLVGDKSEIVFTIMTLAHNLGIDVVVEGIETETQLDALKSLGGTYGQGEVFSMPLDCRGAEELLAEQKVFAL